MLFLGKKTFQRKFVIEYFFGAVKSFNILGSNTANVHFFLDYGEMGKSQFVKKLLNHRDTVLAVNSFEIIGNIVCNFS